MKRAFLGLFLALVLILSIGGTAMAAPLDTEKGFLVFVEYEPWALYEPFNVPVIGAGYAFSDTVAAGLEFQLLGGGGVYAGAFVNVNLGPVLLSGEILTDLPEYVVQVKGLYVFDLGQFKLGAGAGAIFYEWGDPTTFFLEGKGSFAISDHFSIYGGGDILIGALYPWFGLYTIGAAFNF